jgi:hypothetical protein
MDNKRELNLDEAFETLGIDEESATYGGFYRGPISAFMIIMSLMGED